jgi:hypothetical protein
MSRLFGRRHTLAVGTLGLDAFRCVFQVEKTLKPEPNNARIEVYNLTADHRNSLAEMVSKAIPKPKAGHVVKPLAGKIPVRLEAGYEDPGPEQIFLGDLTTVDSERTGTDWVTTITTGSGARANRSARVNQALGPGVPVGEALRAALKALGLGEGNAGPIMAQMKLNAGAAILARGMVLAGPAARALSDICKSANLEWSCQDGVIQVHELGTVLGGRSVLLSPATGLAGSPSVDSDGKLSAKALMVPGLRCGGVVVVESAHVHGGFRIEKLDYRGDTQGPDWGVTIEGKRY